jgi:hypothetical protein
MPEMPTTRETRPSTLNLLLELPKISLSFLSEVYLSKNSQESSWQEESEVLPYMPAEPL